MSGNDGGTGRWKGKVALVTGSSSGIGAAVARRFAGLGASVLVNSFHSVEAGQAVADSLPGARYVRADVGDEQECARLVDVALGEWDRIDVLVNNAGSGPVIPHQNLNDAPLEIWKEVFSVNVFGPWALTVAAAPALAESKGSIVNVTSLAGIREVGSSVPYACSKAATNHMTELLANVVGPEIRVNAVAPGLVDTPWTADWDVIREFVRASAPMQRSGTPQDIAHMILGLVGAKYVTGEIVLVDGGLHLR